MFFTAADPSSRWAPLPRLLNLVWAAIFAAGLVASLTTGHPLWVWIVSGVGLLGWVVRALTPDRVVPLQLGAEAVMIVAGGIACVPGDVLSGVPLAVVLILILGRPERPLWLGILAVPVGVASIGVGVALLGSGFDEASLGGRLIGALSMVAIVALVGVGRRQQRSAESRNKELAAARLRGQRLDDHAAVARELHDVLAHGLGGLVVQLDAVDALIESGRLDEAAGKVRAARQLAVDGLNDARSAVDALRADDTDAPPMTAAGLVAMLTELIDAHRALGGTVTAELDAGVEPLPAPQASALRRTLQESLSNARKHAPGQSVDVRLSVVGSRLELTVSNPLGAPGELSATGGGRGVAGMRERFAELPGGSVEAGAAAGRFTVRAVAAR